MEILEQYYRLVDVKPIYYGLIQPFYTPSQKRFLFNIAEFVMWYDKDQGLYFLQPAVNTPPSGGHDKINKKVIVLTDAY